MLFHENLNLDLLLYLDNQPKIRLLWVQQNYPRKMQITKHLGIEKNYKINLKQSLVHELEYNKLPEIIILVLMSSANPISKTLV